MHRKRIYAVQFTKCIASTEDVDDYQLRTSTCCCFAIGHRNPFDDTNHRVTPWAGMLLKRAHLRTLEHASCSQTGTSSERLNRLSESILLRLCRSQRCLQSEEAALTFPDADSAPASRSECTLKFPDTHVP